MKIKKALDKIMEYSKKNNVDVNMAYIKLMHLISTREETSITKKELEKAHKFIAYNYNLVINKYHDKLSNEDNKKFEDILKEFEIE